LITNFQDLEKSNQWIACAKVTDIDYIKNKIDSIIQSNNIQSSVENKSTKGYNSFQFDLFEHRNQFQDVIDSIKNVALLALNDVYNNTLEDLSLLSSWSVYGNFGGYHEIHRHNDVACTDLSTVLYLSTSEYDTHNTGAFFAVVNNDVVVHQPMIGDLLIFPVGILHGTFPQGHGLRQTLSNDFAITLDETR